MKELILLLTQLFCHHKYQYTEINHDGLNTVECKWCGKRKIVKILPLLALAFVMGCSTKEPSYEEAKRIVEQNKKQEIWHGFQVVVVDSCEYIIRADRQTRGGYQGYGFGFMSHKGNCKFCAERRKKEREELIKALTK